MGEVTGRQQQLLGLGLGLVEGGRQGEQLRRLQPMTGSQPPGPWGDSAQTRLKPPPQ